MKLNLNNKIFVGRYDKNGKLIILLDDDFDILFFKKWQDKCKNVSCKNDYIKDIDFVKVSERGVLKSCFPILSRNEDFVELIYDLYDVYE